MAKKDAPRMTKANKKFDINPEEITWACPDPTWEYSEVWHQIQQSKKQLEELLAAIQQVDSPTLDTDNQTKNQIRSIQRRLEYVADIVSH